MAVEILEADWTWVDGRFERTRVAVSEAGRIEAVGPDLPPPTRRLENVALLPGLVSAHSHAFQRELRTRLERFGGDPATFWSWRERMYRLADRLDEEALAEVSRRTFREMLAAGITTVGEFHYLHGPDLLLDRVVLRAAREAGIRLVLLVTHYRSGGIGQPLAGAQRRFATPAVPAFLQHLERLAGDLEEATQTLGLAAHSVRAVPLEDLRELGAYAAQAGLVLHIHLEEQEAEVEAALAGYGKTPARAVLDTLPAAVRLTVVHATRTRREDLLALGERGATVCLCPLTEAYLADGFPDHEGFLAAGVNLALGTDANHRISLQEEMRWLEYGARLRLRRRGVFLDAQGRAAPRLLAAATVGGATSLGVPVGRIAPGLWADFLALDLTHPSLAGVPPEGLLEAFVFGADTAAIRGTCVGGRWVLPPP